MAIFQKSLQFSLVRRRSNTTKPRFLTVITSHGFTWSFLTFRVFHCFGVRSMWHFRPVQFSSAASLVANWVVAAIASQWKPSIVFGALLLGCWILLARVFIMNILYYGRLVPYMMIHGIFFWFHDTSAKKRKSVSLPAQDLSSHHWTFFPWADWMVCLSPVSRNGTLQIASPSCSQFCRQI